MAQPLSHRSSGGGSTILNSVDDQLWESVTNRDLHGVLAALRRGADVNMICSDGFVREEMAAKKRGIGRSLLHHAAWVGDLEIFKLLVEQGGDVTRKRNTAWRPNGGVRGRGATPLHHACMYGRKDIVKYLIDDAGAEVNEPGEQGYTALHIAVKFNCELLPLFQSYCYSLPR